MSKTTKGRTRESADILIVNAEEMLTLAGSSKTPRVGKQMRELDIIRDGALAIREGKILAVGKTSEVTKNFRGEYVLSAKGKTILPGFVDPHSHLVFAGSREDEFQMRVEGASYMDILSSGGGVLKTAKETHKARTEKLVERGIERLDTMLAHGTTTVESKSGYGLTTEDELKILEANRRLNQLHCIGFHKALLIDFNYDTEPTPGHYPGRVGLPLLKDSRLNHLGKLLFQSVYWHSLLPGRDLPGVSSAMPTAGKQLTPTPKENG